MSPPGLAWLESFRHSTGAALDQGIITRVHPSVNPLVYRVRVDLQEPVKPETGLQIWNLFQQWAAKNGCTPSGRVEMREVPHPASGESFSFGFSVDVHLKERLGFPKDEYP